MAVALIQRAATDKQLETAAWVFEPYIATCVMQEALARWKGEPTQAQVLELVAEFVSSCGLNPALIRGAID
jgi:hypothetical protein